MTRVIGLTGGIGSGKSTVSNFLAELGAIIIDADKIGHESYLPNTETWQALVNTFGKEILCKQIIRSTVRNWARLYLIILTD